MGARTPDLLITNELLYQLSYGGNLIFSDLHRNLIRFWLNFQLLDRRPTHYECVALPTEPQWQKRSDLNETKNRKCGCKSTAFFANMQIILVNCIKFTTFASEIDKINHRNEKNINDIPGIMHGPSA